MFEPLDLVKVRKDQRRAAALLGYCANLQPVSRCRHSYLPSNYWGKPNDVAPSVKPNFSFIREDFQGLSLPAIKKPGNVSNDGNEGNDSNATRHKASVPSNSRGVLGNHQARIAKTRKGISTSQSLPVMNKTQNSGQRETWNSSGNLSEDGGNSSRLATLKAAKSQLPENESPQRLRAQRLNAWNCGDGGGDDDTSNSKIQQRVTFHVPGQDGSQGHVTVQKLKSTGDVLPPLVSIHSSVSTSRSPLSRDHHFPYHHTLGDQQPNLPHSDSNLSNASVHLSQSPPFHILSVDRRGPNPLADLPVDRSKTNSLYTGRVKVRHSKSKVPDPKAGFTEEKHRQPTGEQCQSQESFGVCSVSDGGSDDDPPGALSMSDYSSVSASPGPSLGEADAFSHVWDQESVTEAADTLVQQSPVPTPPVKIPTMTQVVKRFKPLKKPKLARSSDSNINIHRQAYLAALSVARCHQMPKDSSLLSRRFTRPFVFSYFRHIPHQKPCCCEECREHRISNSVIPRKGKPKKFSLLKAIFGNVRVDDYYPCRPIA